MHNLFESLPKFGIKDRIDDRIDEAVHVAKPGRQDENGDAGSAVGVQFRAHGIHNVAREKRHPAYEEDTCATRRREKQKPFQN